MAARKRTRGSSVTKSSHVRTASGTERIPMLSDEESPADIQPEKRGRGRPKGSGKKKGAPPSSSGKSELGSVVDAIQKNYGGLTIVRGNTIAQPERIPTGIFPLDFALVGGYPANRISMLIGQKSAGKTTVAYKVAAHAQQIYYDHQVVWLDLEHTFENKWPTDLGLNVEDVLVAHPDTGEQAVDIAEMAVHAKETSLLVVDSIPALTPFKETEGSADDTFVGIQARLVAKMIRKLVTALLVERKRDHYVTILFINQFRSRIGGPPSFGEPTSVPGGKAMEYCTTNQTTIKKAEEKMGKDVNGNDIILYNTHPFQITKNKLHQGPRTGEFRLIRYDDPEKSLKTGDIDDAAIMLQYAKRFGYLTGAGRGQKLEVAGYEIELTNKEENYKWLYDNPDFYVALRNQLIQRQAISLGLPQDFIDSFVVEVE